ncbi:hypothetical protein BCAR13_630025 [Paraburkholderia caribensis]|nr:hypothetical protein BCAR13_630025 [Paraburkholderia caribensis]
MARSAPQPPAGPSYGRMPGTSRRVVISHSVKVSEPEIYAPIDGVVRFLFPYTATVSSRKVIDDLCALYTSAQPMSLLV